jgi:adenine phosphoribosyltransferase
MDRKNLWQKAKKAVWDMLPFRVPARSAILCFSQRPSPPLVAMPATAQLNLADFIRAIPDFPKPGILFRDITPLLQSPAAFRETIRQLAEPFRGQRIELVAAAEARGFIFSAPLAIELDAGLIPIRKPGKLPCKTLSHTYELEYGTDTLQVHADAMISPGCKVLVVDDLLATGGTVSACCTMIEQAGGQVAGCAFVIELAGLQGRERIAKYPTLSLIKYS